MAIQGLEFDKPTLVNGGHEQKAIVNTASGKQPVNAPTVEDIKRIAKGEAEESSATEWEKSIKEHINYDGSELDVNRDINLNGLDIVGANDVITYNVSCNELYDNETEESVSASNLLDGGRVYKHVIVIQFDNNHFFKFEYYNSDPTPIEDADTIAYDQSFECCSGMYYDNSVQPHTRHVAVIEEIDVGDIHILYGDTGLLLGDIVEVTDTVYQL